MATGQEVHAQLQQTNAERQLLELQIEEQRYKRLRTTSTQRRVQPKRKSEIRFTDQIIFAGLKGTLVGRTLSVGNNMELKNWKCKCIAYLCRNVIIDFTNKDQLKLIGVALEKLNSRFQLFVERAERDLTPLSDATKKIENHASAKTCLKKIEAHNYANSNERATKMIYVHILDQIMNKPILFHGSSRKHFSEMSFLVKFWGPVIELFFDANQCCHWRVRSPIINNPLKSALITKVHLNAVLKRIPYLPAAKIKTVVVPMIQIMGLSCVVYGMNIIDKKVYTLQKISSFNYPSTQREVKSGGIKSLLDGFALVE
ncbi:hypothetical protein INT48_003139, partial [Thamnidium elegans]